MRCRMCENVFLDILRLFHFFWNVEVRLMPKAGRLCRMLPVKRVILLALTLACCASTADTGFSCMSNPCVHGVCIDDLNSTYSCYCIDGYTGVLCQTNWDECWSSPCKNGGFCIDGIASFNCTCPEGFTGDTCEINVDECSSNPCLNNGTCWDDVNGYHCSCIPGFSGTHCEIDIAVCNNTDEERCFNGGLCIEGPGMSFYCKCPAGWEGRLCDDPVDECKSQPCQNGGVCIDLHAAYSCACLFGYSGKNCEDKIEMCNNNPCQNGALCLTEDMERVCYCVPDYHGDLCQFQYDECQLEPRCKNGGSCIDGVDSFSCSCPPGLTGLLCECLILPNDQTDCTYVRNTTITEAPIFTTTSTQKTATFPFESTTYSTVGPISMTSSTAIPSTTLWAESTTISETNEPITTTVPNLTTEEEKHFSTTQTETLVTPTTESTSFETLPEEIFTTETLTEVTTITDMETSTNYGTTMPESTKATFVTWSETSPVMETTEKTETTAVFTLETMTSEEATTTTLEMPTEGEETGSSVAFSTTQEQISTETEFSTALTETSSPTMPTREEEEEATTSAYFDCSVNTCQNGGTCIHTKKGFKCVCPPKTEGKTCERKIGIKNAAFSGHSFIKHYWQSFKDVDISFKAKTMSDNGVVFYAESEFFYMLLLIQDQLLKFKFSCGFQTMLLSELQVKVTTGYEMDVKSSLDFDKNFTNCNASLRINNTLIMTGHQLTSLKTYPKTGYTIYFGMAPKDSMVGYAPGFVGCIYDLKLNGKETEIFQLAQEYSGIAECSALSCLSGPCLNGGTCSEHNGKYRCSCRNGFVGETCEESICQNNPCLFGATCVSYPVTGYLCLCPYGKNGHFCEHDLDISEPSFTSSLHGLASYVAYPIPRVIRDSVEIQFKIAPSTLDQISILMFVGQEGKHDAKSDHLVVSFVKGYIMLTWNLGSGPRRIFTTRPIDSEAGQHKIQLGRFGRRAWLSVDDLGNVTGRSPGDHSDLDVVSVLYIGGHPDRNFTTLPHDLPLHSGFSGCITDVEIRGSGSLMVSSRNSRGAVKGRAVTQCKTSQCHDKTCLGNGACIEHGPTFSCLCQDSWFGPQCSSMQNPCDTGYHNCSTGSTCVPLIAGYECDCPPGFTGKYCEKAKEISDVSLSGVRSFLAVDVLGLDSAHFTLELELRPLQDKGLILFAGNTAEGPFFSLSMQGGVLEARIKPMNLKRNMAKLLLIRANKIAAIGEWLEVKFGRYGRKVFLSVNGAVNSGVLHPGDSMTITDSTLYIGGLEGMSELPVEATASYPEPYKGCARRLIINNHHYQMWPPKAARNADDCDGTPCGGDLCENGGSCWLDPNLVARCICPPHFSGAKCEIPDKCSLKSCLNGGRCRPGDDASCTCSVGWGGAYCETAIEVKTPKFNGAGFVKVNKKARQAGKSRDLVAAENLELLKLNFSTAEPSGLIFWSSKGEEFVGVGLERSQLKIAWSWQKSRTVVVEIASSDPLSDGMWHTITVQFRPGNVSFLLDDIPTYTNQLHGAPAPLMGTPDLGGVFYLGGVPGKAVSLLQETKGLFPQYFKGCITSLTVAKIDGTINDFSKYEGENVESCPVF